MFMTQPTPTVSVIIPNYNYGRYVGEAIESVMTQTVPVHEIIVVDDGSTDNSKEIVSAYGERVKLICQKNRGVGAARNAGVAASTGEYVAFLDADDVWLPNKTERQLEQFAADPEIGMVTCGMLEVSLSGQALSQFNEGLEGWVAEDLLLFKRSVVVGSGSTALIKRSVFEAVGGVDETKEMHPSEDWYFNFRVAQISRMGFVPELLVYYRNHGGNGHLNIRRMERAVRLALGKTFADPNPQVQRLRRESYGNQYMILAGSYFGARQYADFARTAVKSLCLTPGNVVRLLGYPLRRLQRRGESRKKAYQSA